MNAEPKLTRNQALVFQTLEKAGQPLSAYTILDRLRDDGFRAPLQVYRALDKLLETGLVHRLESINSFVACAHPHPHSHGSAAFAICETCGRVDEFSDKTVQARLADWSKEHGFRTNRTMIEIRGQCVECNEGRS
jgi:Fur family transcriptional regulator, zinc uptake regulator